MHALTRSMSGMYCWQSRIASGSQAARCAGVHCCAAAGPDANVSARPTSAVGSAAAATIGQSFACAIRISIIDPPVGVLPRYLLSIQRAWQAAMLATVILQESSRRYAGHFTSAGTAMQRSCNENLYPRKRGKVRARAVCVIWKLNTDG